MIFKVEMLAFMEPGTIREVDIPDDEYNPNKPVFTRLDQVFHWGQNDFQPIAGKCSVSVGDVIQMDGHKFRVDSASFHQFTDEDYQSYLAMDRGQRMMECFD